MPKIRPTDKQQYSEHNIRNWKPRDTYLTKQLGTPVGQADLLTNSNTFLRTKKNKKKQTRQWEEVKNEK